MLVELMVTLSAEKHGLCTALKQSTAMTMRLITESFIYMSFAFVTGYLSPRF
jgi:hypothetical protein